MHAMLHTRCPVHVYLARFVRDGVPAASWVVGKVSCLSKLQELAETHAELAKFATRVRMLTC